MQFTIIYSSIHLRLPSYYCAFDAETSTMVKIFFWKNHILTLSNYIHLTFILFNKILYNNKIIIYFSILLCAFFFVMCYVKVSSLTTPDNGISFPTF